MVVVFIHRRGERLDVNRKASSRRTVAVRDSTMAKRSKRTRIRRLFTGTLRPRSQHPHAHVGREIAGKLQRGNSNSHIVSCAQSIVMPHNRVVSRATLSSALPMRPATSESAPRAGPSPSRRTRRGSRMSRVCWFSLAFLAPLRLLAWPSRLRITPATSTSFGTE